MSRLTDLLAREAISLHVHADIWQEAVAAAGRLLERTDVSTPDYTQAMIDSVVEHGPYIVLAPGFAFAHARPSPAVRRTGMSWVRLAAPVEFGHKQNDPVSLVVALAAQDDRAHRQAMAELAGLIADPERKRALDWAASPDDVLRVLRGDRLDDSSEAFEAEQSAHSHESGSSKSHRALTVCGNGLGTSLFLKNTLEKVLDHWGWGPYVSVEATDTISARGQANDVDFILTSGEIARTLGEVNTTVHIIENFTSTSEIDAALRQIYDV